MIETGDFGTLSLMFRRPGGLPALPANTLRLIREIDRGEASTTEIEAIVLSDPALTADVLRLSNSGEFGGCPGGSLRSAIFLVGYRCLKALAVSSLVQSLLRGNDRESKFDAPAYLRHSTFVALLARYVAARAERSGRVVGCTPDEAFAAGMLHDLPFALLARVAPQVYSRLYLRAQHRQIGLDVSFREVYGRPVSELGAVACRALGLPPLFAEIMECWEDPWGHPDLFLGACAVRYAEHTAAQTEWRMERWPVAVEADAFLEEAVGLPADELDVVTAKVGEAARAMDCGIRTAAIGARRAA